MKNLRMLFCHFILVFLFVSSLPAQTENPDKPKLGQWDFKLQEEWTVTQAENEPFFQITQMKIPYNGPIYIYDYKRAQFLVFDPESGDLLQSFGKQGQGPGEFNMVLDFFLTPELFIVYDFGKIHFLSLDKNYEYLESQVLDKTTGEAPSLFLDRHHFLTVPRDPAFPDAPLRLDINHLDQGRISTIAGASPSELGLKPSKTKPAATSLGGGGVGAYKTTESYILTVKDNILYYGLNDQYSIHAVELNGKKEMSLSIPSRKRAKTSREYRKNREESLKNGRNNLPAPVLQQLIDNIPQESTYFYKIYIDGGGHIYVFISDLENSTIETIDIFSPQGEYVYRSEIQSPDGFSFHTSGVHFFKNSVFCIVENEEGEIQLKKYRINPPSFD